MGTQPSGPPVNPNPPHDPPPQPAEEEPIKQSPEQGPTKDDL